MSDSRQQRADEFLAKNANVDFQVLRQIVDPHDWYIIRLRRQGYTLAEVADELGVEDKEIFQRESDMLKMGKTTNE